MKIFLSFKWTVYQWTASFRVFHIGRGGGGGGGGGGEGGENGGSQ